MEYFKRYTGTESVSIVNALAEMGENSSYANRKLIATANGIADYSGTATQNLMMLSLLKDGKLIKPGIDAPAQPENTAEPTKRGFGRKVLIGALVLGAGIAAYKMFGGDEPTKTATKKSGKKKAAKKGRKGLNGTGKATYRVGDIVEANFTNQFNEHLQYPCIIKKKKKLLGKQYYETHQIEMNKYPFVVGEKNAAFIVDWRTDSLTEDSLRPISADKKAAIRKLLKKK